MHDIRMLCTLIFLPFDCVPVRVGQSINKDWKTYKYLISILLHAGEESGVLPLECRDV